MYSKMIFFQLSLLPQASITLFFMAAVHLIFYIPQACVRITALFAPTLGIVESALTLTGASFVCYAFGAPVHLANFLVRCARVNGFAEAMSNLIMFKVPSGHKRGNDCNSRIRLSLV